MVGEGRTYILNSYRSRLALRLKFFLLTSVGLKEIQQRYVNLNTTLIAHEFRLQLSTAIENFKIFKKKCSGYS